jgi:hypothetical protein
MMQFLKPTNLNGEELRQELKAAGISISDDSLAVQDDAEGHLLLDIAKKDETKAQGVVSTHNGSI